jgi:hypothetical protein
VLWNETLRLIKRKEEEAEEEEKENVKILDFI